MARPYQVTSHESFSHDSLDSLGYDWERVADPTIRPRYPLKVYLPQTTEDIVAVVREARELGQKLIVRSKGHSSNDLVLQDRGVVLCTQKLDSVLELDEQAMTVRVQSGVVLAQLDTYLGARGYGLPVIGDHNDITAGGFASVGGIGPASLRYGLFVDNVTQLEYVTWEGEVVSCGRDQNSGRFLQVLTGLGQHGVIATLTLQIIRVDKWGHILENDRTLYRRLDDFVRDSGAFLNDPGDTVLGRGFWLDFGRGVKVGQMSLYKDTPQTTSNSVRNRLFYTYLHAIGSWAGRAPRRVEPMLKLLGVAGMIWVPRRSSIKNVETFSDRVLDSTTGDPTRMLIALVPSEQYPALLRELYSLCQEYRKPYKCFTFISFYIKSIRSEYLTNGGPHRYYCELILLPGIRPEGMTPEVLEQFVSRMDDLCIRYGAYRYMHTKTVKDLERRRLIDPNATYSSPLAALENPAPWNGEGGDGHRDARPETQGVRPG